MPRRRDEITGHLFAGAAAYDPADLEPVKERQKLNARQRKLLDRLATGPIRAEGGSALAKDMHRVWLNDKIPVGRRAAWVNGGAGWEWWRVSRDHDDAADG